MMRKQFEIGPTGDRAGAREGKFDLRRNIEHTSSYHVWQVTEQDAEELCIVLYEFLRALEAIPRRGTRGVQIGDGNVQSNTFHY